MFKFTLKTNILTKNAKTNANTTEVVLKYLLHESNCQNAHLFIKKIKIVYFAVRFIFLIFRQYSITTLFIH